MLVTNVSFFFRLFSIDQKTISTTAVNVFNLPSGNPFNFDIFPKIFNLVNGFSLYPADH